jgi:hypothetical protein
MSTYVIPADPTGVAFLSALRAGIAALGEAVSYQPGGENADPIQLTGLWREGSDIAAQKPGALAVVQFCQADLPFDPAKGDLITHEGILFDITEATIGDHGAIWLWLRAA